MANEFSRNIQDAEWIKTAALPNGDATTSSADFDIGESEYVKPSFEMSIQLPALTGTELDADASLTVGIASGDSPSPTNMFARIYIQGNNSGLAANELRYTLPSNTDRYVKVYFLTQGGAGNLSAKSATIKLLF